MTLHHAESNNTLSAPPEVDSLPPQRSIGLVVAGLTCAAYLTNIIYLTTDFIQRSRRLEEVLEVVFYASPVLNKPAFWSIHITSSLLVSVSCLTFTPTTIARLFQEKCHDSNNLKEFVNNIIGNDIKNHPFKALSFLCMTLNIALTSTMLLDILIKPTMNSISSLALYLFLMLSFTVSCLLYYFFFTFEDIIKKTHLGISYFLEVFNKLSEKDECSIAILVFMHMLTASGIRLFQIAFGPFIFMSNLKAPSSASYVVSIISTLLSIYTLPAMRIQSAYVTFYPIFSSLPERQAIEQAYWDQAKIQFETLSYVQKGKILLLDPAIFLVIGVVYGCSRLSYHFLRAFPVIGELITTAIALILTASLIKLFEPAAKQRIINAFYKKNLLETSNSSSNSSGTFILSSIACSFYRFSQTISLIDTLQKLLPLIFNSEHETGRVAIILALSVMSYLSYSSYEFHQPKVEQSLIEVKNSISCHFFSKHPRNLSAPLIDDSVENFETRQSLSISHTSDC